MTVPEYQVTGREHSALGRRHHHRSRRRTLGVLRNLGHLSQRRKQLDFPRGTSHARRQSREPSSLSRNFCGQGRSSDLGPELRWHETRQMPDVGRRNNHPRPIQGCSLRSKDDVAVKRRIGCRRPALLASFGPEHRRPAHRRGRDGQVLDLTDEGIKPRDARRPPGPDQLSPNLVVGISGTITVAPPTTAPGATAHKRRLASIRRDS